jgi:O-antigen biosynthesis protein
MASYGITKYVKNDRNRKLPYSLNRGFERADGEFHTWTSADNYMLPGMLRRLSEELVQHEDVGIIFHKYVIFDAGGRVVDTEADYAALDRLVGSSRYLPDAPARYTYYSTLGACFMYRKDVWKAMRSYDEHLHGAEDFDFWIRAARQFRIRRLPWDDASLYVYRLHGQSISSTVEEAFNGMRLKVLGRELKEHPQDAELRRALRILRAKRRVNVVRSFARNWLRRARGMLDRR